MEPSPAEQRFTKLPEPVDPVTMITTKESAPVPDPDGGRATERDFLLRNAAG